MSKLSDVKPLVAIDCIIFGFDREKEMLKLLVIKGDFEQGGVKLGKWSLMTGFLKTGETIDEAANRILFTLTGISDIYMEQLHTFGTIFSFQPRTIAVSYYALIPIENEEELKDKYSAHWIELPSKPKLPFDHDKMVDLAIRRLRHKATTEPIGFKLLPERFTMRQLQKLYEGILGEEVDKRNFIKKISSLDVLDKLSAKEKGSSKKGSFLYKFNIEKYEKKKRDGFAFAV